MLVAVCLTANGINLSSWARKRQPSAGRDSAEFLPDMLILDTRFSSEYLTPPPLGLKLVLSRTIDN